MMKAVATDVTTAPTRVEADNLWMLHLSYALYLFGPAITFVSFGLLGVGLVVLSYVFRAVSRGTWMASHYGNQILGSCGLY
jgi:uncharacterized membrane protein